MRDNAPKCIKLVVLKKSCIYCEGKSIKHGSINGKQRYLCRQCRRSFMDSYIYNAYKSAVNDEVKSHIKEGCGIRSISRLLKISPGTVLRRIMCIARSIVKPVLVIVQSYELDELCTYVKKKTGLVWVAYALSRADRTVADFIVGSRTMVIIIPTISMMR